MNSLKKKIKQRKQQNESRSLLIYKTLHSRDVAPLGKNRIANEHPFPLEQKVFETQPPSLPWPFSLWYCTFIVATPQVSDDVHISVLIGSNTELSDRIVEFIP